MSDLPLTEEHNIAIAKGIPPPGDSNLSKEPGYIRRQMAADPHRPGYHFQPPANWMNDPNGLIQWQGRYHLFYQHNPAGPFHDHIHWGHAVSNDLVHWQDLPIALSPTPGGPDAEGCWSGCAVDNDGVPTFIYSGVNPQTVCLATSSDGLINWQKYTGNPVIATVPEGIDAGMPWDFRDPFLWREGDTWYMLMGSRIDGVGGATLLYCSTDLLTWEYLNPFLMGDKEQTDPYFTGTVWECPNLVSFKDKEVFIISYQDQVTEHLLYTGYYLGSIYDHRFVPESQGILDYGGHFYAPQVMKDDRDRWLMWGWLWEGRTPEAQLESGWAGVMSLPRQLGLHEDGRLSISPVPELQKLRDQVWRRATSSLDPADGEVLLGVEGDCLEILMEIKSVGATAFGLLLRHSPINEEFTTLFCDFNAGTFTVERENSGPRHKQRYLNPAQQVVRHAPLVWGADKVLRLHIFLDRSVLEIFINERVTFSTRIYPDRPDSTGIGVYALGGKIDLLKCDIWSLKSIWD